MEKNGFCCTHYKQVDCRVGARRRPLGPTGSGNSPTGSGCPVEIHGYDPPLAVLGESVQGNCPRGYSLWKHRFATRPEPEVARPEPEIAPVAGPSFGDIAAVSSRNQSVESGREWSRCRTSVGLPTSDPTRTGNHSNPFPPHSKPTVFQYFEEWTDVRKYIVLQFASVSETVTARNRGSTRY